MPRRLDGKRGHSFAVEAVFAVFPELNRSACRRAHGYVQRKRGADGNIGQVPCPLAQRASRPMSHSMFLPSSWQTYMSSGTCTPLFVLIGLGTPPKEI